MRLKRSPTPSPPLIGPEDNEDTTISAKQALAMAHRLGKQVTTATLHKWLDNYNRTHDDKIAHQPSGNGGRYYVFKLRFYRFLTGKEV